MGGVMIETDNPANLARLALAAGLYVEGWELEGWLIEFDPERHYIAIAKNADNRLPVGVCYCCDKGFISVFVMDQYRRRGIGSELVGTVRAIYENSDPVWSLEAGIGILESPKFWASVDIPCS